MVLSCLFLVVAATPAACGSAKAPQSQASPASHVYFNEKHHFSLRIDSRFEDIYRYSLPGTALKVGLFDKDGAAPGATPDGLAITLVDKKRNAGRSTAECARLLNKLAAELEAVGPGAGKPWFRTTVGGLPAAWNEDVDLSNKYRRISYLVIGHRNVYLLAGAATPQSWNSSRQQFVDAIESFREL